MKIGTLVIVAAIAFPATALAQSGPGANSPAGTSGMSSGLNATRGAPGIGGTRAPTTGAAPSSSAGSNTTGAPAATGAPFSSDALGGAGPDTTGGGVGSIAGARGNSTSR